MDKRKIITVAISIVFLAIGGFAVAYISNSPIIDSLLPVELRERRISKRTIDSFPDVIGVYSLVNAEDQKVKIMRTCNKIEDNEILWETGRTGDACMEIFSALYGTVVSSTISTTTSKIVNINLSRFTAAADLLELLVEKTTKPDTLGGRPIFRTAPFRLGWSPLERFDMIITEEGESAVSSTTSSMKYEGTATGDNDVTKYFISKYPPNQ